MLPITNKNYANTTFTVEFPLFSQIKLFSGFISVIHWLRFKVWKTSFLLRPITKMLLCEQQL